MVLAGVPAWRWGFILARFARSAGPPIASRAAAPVQNRGLDALVAQVEAHLAKNPEDGRGWEVVAPVYMRFGRFEDAVKARRNAIRLNGASADREADLGESLMAAANGVVTDEAKAAFERAASIRKCRRRFFLGVAAHRWAGRQGGFDLARYVERGAAGFALGRNGARDARASGALAEQPCIPRPVQPPGRRHGGRQDGFRDRSAIVRGMVSNLPSAARGTDVDGWLRLVRAYTVMGMAGDAA